MILKTPKLLSFSAACQKNILPEGVNCAVTCCTGDMCNQQSPKEATASPTPNGTESTTAEPVTKGIVVTEIKFLETFRF